MKLQVLDIPEGHAERVGWLERLIAGPDLGDVVSELAALQGDPPNGATLEKLLGTQLQSVSDQGLGALPVATLNQLMNQPTLLLQLQERVLSENKPYWDRLLAENYSLAASSDRITARTLNAIETLTGASSPTIAPPTSSWVAHPLVVCLLTAAAVAGIFFGLQTKETSVPPVAVGWGWSKPGAMNESLKSPAYLKSLADGAKAWFNKTPEDAAGVAKRIAEFRQGCSQLILAEHKPLSAEDKKWLVERCQVWAGKLDKHLADIEAGRPPLEVRAEADTTINNLIKAIEGRATMAVG